jgi:hypothetical protein
MCTSSTRAGPEDSTECDREDLVFDESIVTSSLVRDFQLVCGRWGR